MILLIAVLLLAGIVVAVVRRAVDASRLVPEGEEEIPDPADGDFYGWLHQRLVDGFALERASWAAERAARVEARLQAHVPPAERMDVVILWMREVTAFTSPAGHVYVSRRLIERAGTDDALAFVVAHEMAHHALGHLSRRSRLVDRLSRVPGGAWVAALALDVDALRRSPSDELAADAHALRACMAAGYDPARCMDALSILEGWLLDHGDLEGVYGPDGLIEAEVEGRAEWRTRMARSAWERQRGYPSLVERRRRLQAIAWPAAE